MRSNVYYRSLVNWLKLFWKHGYWNWSWLFRYGWNWIRPTAITKWSLKTRGFNLVHLAFFRNELWKLGKAFPLWWPRIFEPETLGVRSWEYGNLLTGLKNMNYDFRHKKILDIGTGGSLLPDYLAEMGAEVTTVDIEQPLENRRYEKNVTFVQSSMTRLPFKSESYDLVLCISALEHLDMKYGYDKLYNKKTYEKRALAAILEMKRVTKRDGFVYLTTDFYKNYQKSDNWPLSGKRIKGAFVWPMLGQFSKLFNQVEILGGSTYRGEGFRTIGWWWQKD